MRRFYHICFIALALCLCPFVSFAKAPGVEYYFNNYCESCRPQDELRRDYYEYTGEKLPPEGFVYFNIREAEGRLAYENALARYGLNKDTGALPLLIVNGNVFSGNQAIETQLPEYGLSLKETTDSILYYLYTPACENCLKVRRLLDALPQTITVTRGKYSFASDVRVVSVDINGDTELAYALFDAYNVTRDERIAPMIIAGDRFYAGLDDISLFVRTQIYRGKAVGTKLIDVSRERPPQTRIGESAVAGIIGGLNPCALSMLLLLLSVLTQIKDRVLLLSFIYLSVKLLVYLLIGVVLLEVFRRWNPVWLPMAAKALMTVMSIALAYLNIHDAVMARRERYGGMKTQLPSKLRGRLSDYIGKIRLRKAWLIPAVALTAAVVSSSEFLCAGQVYLATILYNIRNRVSWSSYISLLTYCLSFLLPSAALCVLVSIGKSARILAETVRLKLPFIKAATAVFYIAIVIIAWIF